MNRLILSSLFCLVFTSLFSQVKRQYQDEKNESTVVVKESNADDIAILMAQFGNLGMGQEVRITTEMIDQAKEKADSQNLVQESAEAVVIKPAEDDEARLSVKPVESVVDKHSEQESIKPEENIVLQAPIAQGTEGRPSGTISTARSSGTRTRSVSSGERTRKKVSFRVKKKKRRKSGKFKGSCYSF